MRDPKPYMVSIADYAGTFRSVCVATFADALQARETLLRRYSDPERARGHGLVVTIENTDYSDMDGERAIDGLTDDEREAL